MKPGEQFSFFKLYGLLAVEALLALAIIYFGNRYVNEVSSSSGDPKISKQTNAPVAVAPVGSVIDVSFGDGKGVKATEHSTALIIILGLTLLFLALIIAKYVRFK